MAPGPPRGHAGSRAPGSAAHAPSSRAFSPAGRNRAAAHPNGPAMPTLAAPLFSRQAMPTPPGTSGRRWRARGTPFDTHNGMLQINRGFGHFNRGFGHFGSVARMGKRWSFGLRVRKLRCRASSLH